MLTNFVRSKSRADYEVTKKKWLKMSIVDLNGTVQAKDGKIITHNEYIDWFIDELMELINDYQYIIEDEKKFKEEIAHFIYTLSDTGNHG